MEAMNVLIVALMVTSVYVDSQPPVFLVDPVSITAVDGTTVEFTCTAENAEDILYIVNRSSAGNQDVQDKGFTELGAEPLNETVLRKNLKVTVSSQYNNTEIFCTAVGTNIVDSETANLTVQGPLSSVRDLSYFFINSSTVHISWSPPFTLPGTTITGYNISVTSNGTTTNYYTSVSYYVLQLSDITDSPCNEINITVSGYNGLNGENDSISVPSSNPVVPLSVDVLEDLQVTLIMNVTNICIDERPTTVNVTLFRDNTVVYRTDVMVSDGSSTEMATVTITHNVVEDTNYTVKVSFGIFDGDFTVSSCHVFNTVGVRSVNLTDTDNDSVLCRCVFNSFSTDTGCTIILVLSEVIRHEQNFTRSGDTATGSISGVATGLYQVKVFDQGSSVVVLTSELMVIGEPVTTTTTTSVTSSMATNTQTVPVVSTNASIPVAASATTTVTISSSTKYITVGVPIGVVILILSPVLTLITCLVCRKKYHNRNSHLQSSHGSAVLYCIRLAVPPCNESLLTSLTWTTTCTKKQGEIEMLPKCADDKGSTGLQVISNRPKTFDGQGEGTNIQATTDII